MNKILNILSDVKVDAKPSKELEAFKQEVLNFTSVFQFKT